MKSKYLFIIAFVAFNTASLSAQQSKLMLKDYINAALNNKPNIMALKVQTEIEALKTAQLDANFWPQVALSYDNIYSPIVRSSIVPVGKFSPIPTDEVRAIKFGTNFQQNLGVKAFQPLYDATVKSRIAESKIVEKLKQTDVKIATEELVFEVSQTYIKAFIKQQEAKENVADTNRTFKNLMLLKEKFANGKILKTEVNKAQINHNNASEFYRNTAISLMGEKIYLGFLTGKKSEDIFINENDEALNEANLNWVNDASKSDALASIEQLNNNIDLTKQQINSEKSKYKPTVGLNGYLGVDQFSQNFNPFEKNSWFGNAFLGVAVKLPILLPENKANKSSQYQLQIKNYDLQKSEITREVEKNKAMALNEISKIKAEYENTLANVNLYKEDLLIIQERLKQGKATTFDLENEELELQKENQKLNSRKSKMWLQWLVVLKSNGSLGKLY